MINIILINLKIQINMFKVSTAHVLLTIKVHILNKNNNIVLFINQISITLKIQAIF